MTCVLSLTSQQEDRMYTSNEVPVLTWCAVNANNADVCLRTLARIYLEPKEDVRRDLKVNEGVCNSLGIW